LQRHQNENLKGDSGKQLLLTTMHTQRQISALLIENDTYWQDTVRHHLEPEGIHLHVASNAREGRALAEKLWNQIDVAILDVQLKDPEEETATGPGIIMEVREKKQDSFGPECIVFTDYQYNDYYRLALNLGAAVYHVKAAADRDPIAPYVRVLALRRALNERNPKLSSKLEHIAGASSNISEAILTFACEVLGPAFKDYLNVPFFILFTEKEKTWLCAHNRGLPEKPPEVYHTLQALAHGKGSPIEPFSLDVGKLKLLNPETTSLYYDFDQAVLLPISLSNNLKLSIGILPHDRAKSAPDQTNQAHLSRVLAQHLRPTVLERIIGLWSHWTEQRTTRISMAKLCLSVGQDIHGCIEENNLKELDNMAGDLNETGTYLSQLDNERQVEVTETVLVKDVVDEAWEWIGTPDVKLEMPKDCSVKARRTDLEVVMSRLLQWFIYRSKYTPVDVAPVINIACTNTDRAASITLEDTSQRLPKALRDDLFAPFTQAITTPFSQIRHTKPQTLETSGQAPAPSYHGTGRYLPLYLAKMIVEGRYQGSLQDQSNQITGRNYGHRICMQFPENKIH
jgi:DNA-binding NarL/FixJ family response regulator